MFNSEKKTEDKVNYECTVLAVRKTKYEDRVMFDMDVNGVKIYSCVLKEVTVKKDGEKYKKGDKCYMINMPQEKSGDKWYDRVWFPISGKITDSVVDQVQKLLA
jgi:DNA-binding cell septation regulator SpoVG